MIRAAVYRHPIGPVGVVHDQDRGWFVVGSIVVELMRAQADHEALGRLTPRNESWDDNLCQVGECSESKVLVAPETLMYRSWVSVSGGTDAPAVFDSGDRGAPDDLTDEEISARVAAILANLE